MIMFRHYNRMMQRYDTNQSCVGFISVNNVRILLFVLFSYPADNIIMQKVVTLSVLR